MTSLNPVMSVGNQLTEAIRAHQGSDNAETVALKMLDAVQITEPARRLKQYPHELSGGMQQRASIARALAFDADLLLMDEPFGALDEIVRDHLNEELLKLWTRTNKTICFV
ncbi:ATP-binding cassette domain-containing protein, partial [Rhizobium ruizarguesonis]